MQTIHYIDIYSIFTIRKIIFFACVVGKKILVKRVKMPKYLIKPTSQPMFKTCKIFKRGTSKSVNPQEQALIC